MYIYSDRLRRAHTFTTVRPMIVSRDRCALASHEQQQQQRRREPRTRRIKLSSVVCALDTLPDSTWAQTFTSNLHMATLTASRRSLVLLPAPLSSHLFPSLFFHGSNLDPSAYRCVSMLCAGPCRMSLSLTSCARPTLSAPANL